MTCRIQCQPAPETQCHLPTFSPPDLPDGFAECLLCGDWITAVEFLGEECPALAVKHSDQLNAWRSGDEPEAEREATLSMIARCAEHQL